MAVFQATNDTEAEISCITEFPPESSERVSEMLEVEALAAHSGATWRYAVSDTNSVRHLETACFEPTPPLCMRLVTWFALHPALDPNHRIVEALLSYDRHYKVTCPTEVR